MRRRAFSLVEIMLVVAILGILGAIVLPSFQNNATNAREVAAKDILRKMRAQIELYKFHHNGYPPGYINGILLPEVKLPLQFIGTTTETGLTSPSTVPSGQFVYGPYFKSLPVNPFNKLSNIAYVDVETAFADAVDGTSSGWLYKKETSEFKINWTGQDSEGVNFYDY
jgi:general secretion pathway protein G